MNVKAWTDEEYSLVLHSEWTLERIAKELGRTRSSVKATRARLLNGWTPGSEKVRWTKAEDEFLLANVCMTAADAGHQLQRTKRSVQARREFLRQRGESVRKYPINSSPHKVGARPLLAKTCPDCGLLLQAMWFRAEGQGRSWSKGCRRCHPAKKHYRNLSQDSHRYTDLLQNLTVPGAAHHAKPWLESDMKVLADPDMTIFQKALALKRTYFSISNAARTHGFSSKVGLGDPKRDQWRIDNPNADRIDEITASLKQEFKTAGAPFPAWDWDDEDLKETAA